MLLLLASFGLSVASAAPSHVLRHARLWDGTGAPVIEDAWIAVEDGRIAAVGAEPAPELDGPALDLHGATVVPGLIDAHTHPWAVPGADLRGDDEATRDAFRQQGLRAFVACGFTTVLDAGASWDQVHALRGWLAEGLPGPRYLTLGPVMGPPHGYVEAFLPEHPGIPDLAAAEAHLDRLVEEGAVGAKLTIEPGYFLPVLPLHDAALREQIVAAATARGLPVMIHAQRRSAHEAALDLNPAAVLHMVRDRPGDLVERYAASGTPLVTTLALEASPRVRFDAHRLDRPLARLVVPQVQRDTALSAAGWRAYKRGMAHVSLPGWPRGVTNLAAAFMPVDDYLQGSLRRVERTTRRLHRAGATLVLGSDSGAYDVVSSYFHGVHGLTELELLVDAGFTPEEALLAGTRQAAALLGMAGEIGVISPGASADLVIVEGDPLADISAMWDVQAVMQQGELRSPRGWMQGPARQ
ncbi:MAG: amidohydrolase family protein [Alphaproteobacteria bacterium]|nr:amidohydrolase family protein [Alphaproteobacteria bacterium]